MRQATWTWAPLLVFALLAAALSPASAAAACASGAACACTSDSTCVAANSTTTSTTTTTTVFATGGRCDALGVCRLASGFACGAALLSNGSDSSVLAFVANDFECHADLCACRGSLVSCSVLDDAARSLTCSADSLAPSDACPRFACTVAEPTTTTTAARTTTADPCHAVTACDECQLRADCVYCGESGCVGRSQCADSDAAAARACPVETFWNDTTTAVIAAVVVAGVLVLILCIVAAITKQHDSEPVQDPFVLEMRSVSENDRIALVKKDLRAAEAAEKAKINAADANEDSALTESA